MSKSTWPWRSLIALTLCALMLSGCALMQRPPEPQTSVVPTAPGLLKLCPPLPELTRGTAASLLTDRTRRAELYADCSVTHKRLVQSIQLRVSIHARVVRRGRPRECKCLIALAHFA